jgi:hypothetical protein
MVTVASQIWRQESLNAGPSKSNRHARPKCRASTNFCPKIKDVDGRDKPGHDEISGNQIDASIMRRN